MIKLYLTIDNRKLIETSKVFKSFHSICSCECTWLNKYTLPLLVILAKWKHLFSFRTQQLSPLAPKILAWKRAGKIGHCQLSNLRSVSFSFFLLAWPDNYRCNAAANIFTWPEKHYALLRSLTLMLIANVSTWEARNSHFLCNDLTILYF